MGHLKETQPTTQPSSHRRNRLGWRLPAALLALFYTWLPVEVLFALQFQAQVGAGAAVADSRQVSRSNDPFSAVLQASEEATTLLARADEGVQRKDWKLAIDSLQRIVELPGGHVLTSDGRIYESARWHAHRRIAALPPAGLQAYRLVYDGEASTLLARALEQHEASLLRTIIDRFLISSVGDEAALTLADWLIDEGNFSEAADILRRLQSVYPDADIPAWAVPMRLAVCAAGMGQGHRAENLLQSGKVEKWKSGPDIEKKADTMTLAERIGQIKAYIQREAISGEVEQADSWPMAFGSASRNGRMPAIEPRLIDHRAWKIQLPIIEPRAGLAAIQDYMPSPGLMPIRQVVTDGKVLIVKGQRELLALDADSFVPLWQTQRQLDDFILAATEGVSSSRTIPLGNRQDKESLLNDPDMIRMFTDTVGSSVALAFDMALTIEWLEDPPLPLDTNLKKDRQQRAFQGLMVAGAFTETHPNRVVAYSLADGSLLWKSDTSVGGGSSGSAAELSEVEFLSVPIPVDGMLLAPCRVSSDLYAVVLDPATGKLVHHIYLCGTGGGPFDSSYALLPCAADGMVFIPTGRGVLVALEVSTWSIRWAARYNQPDQRLSVDGLTVSEGRWLVTPVVAVADVVLLAPPDADELICLDRSTGQVRWRVNRGNSSYVLGATDTHVWAAGRELQLIEIETGCRLWNKEIDNCGGRGVIAGEVIYLPVDDGVLLLNALTGEKIKLEQPPSPIRFGNLFVWDGSLYSISHFYLQKFPDLNRGYKLAVDRHAADPADASRAIRLAWLELLQDRPARALAALAEVSKSGTRQNERLYEQAIHLRVRSMLELAAGEEIKPVEALRLLEEARRISISPQDAVESALALGDFHRRKGSSEGCLEACFQYLSLVLSQQGDQMITDPTGVERKARSVAVQRIIEASGKLSSSDARVLAEKIRSWQDEAVEKHNEVALQWLTQSIPLGAPADKAALVLGTWAADELRFEEAESYFAQVLRCADTPELLAEATARLASIYLEPEELHLPVSALSLLDRLENEFGNVQLPEDILDTRVDGSKTAPPSAAPAAPRGLGRPALYKPGLPGPAALLVDTLRGRIDGKILRDHRAAMESFVLGGPNKPTMQTYAAARPLSVRGSRVEPLADKWMLLVEGSRVQTHDADNGQMLWPAELKLLGELAVESRTPKLTQTYFGSQGEIQQRARGVVDGQTLIVNSCYGLHAIGLLTGRRLWTRPFDPPNLEAISADPSGQDAWIWAHDGYLVSVDARGHLEVSFARRGNDILWRCNWPHRRWYAVRARGSYLVAADADLQQVDIFRLADGRYLGECRFTQQADLPKKINIALFDEVICGPISARDVAALELARPGSIRWRTQVPSDLSQIFKPTPDSLAIADRSGRVQVIDPDSGTTRMAATIYDACKDGVIDGASMDGVLYVCGYQQRASGVISYDEQRWGLAAIKMDTGVILWQKGDFGARAYLSDDILRCSSNGIPVVVFVPPAKRDRKSFPSDGESNLDGGVVELTILDKTTGEVIGEKVKAPLAKEAGFTRILDVQLWPGKVLVTSGSAQLQFPVGKGPKEKGGKE